MDVVQIDIIRLHTTETPLTSRHDVLGVRPDSTLGRDATLRRQKDISAPAWVDREPFSDQVFGISVAVGTIPRSQTKVVDTVEDSQTSGSITCMTKCVTKGHKSKADCVDLMAAGAELAGCGRHDGYGIFRAP